MINTKIYIQEYIKAYILQEIKANIQEDKTDMHSIRYKDMRSRDNFIRTSNQMIELIQSWTKIVWSTAKNTYIRWVENLRICNIFLFVLFLFG